jgi:hypothetical protein
LGPRTYGGEDEGLQVVEAGSGRGLRIRRGRLIVICGTFASLGCVRTKDPVMCGVSESSTEAEPCLSSVAKVRSSG